MTTENWFQVDAPLHENRRFNHGEECRKKGETIDMDSWTYEATCSPCFADLSNVVERHTIINNYATFLRYFEKMCDVAYDSMTTEALTTITATTSDDAPTVEEIEHA